MLNVVVIHVNLTCGLRTLEKREYEFHHTCTYKLLYNGVTILYHKNNCIDLIH